MNDIFLSPTLPHVQKNKISGWKGVLSYTFTFQSHKEYQVGPFKKNIQDPTVQILYPWIQKKSNHHLNNRYFYFSIMLSTQPTRSGISYLMCNRAQTFFLYQYKQNTKIYKVNKMGGYVSYFLSQIVKENNSVPPIVKYGQVRYNAAKGAVPSRKLRNMIQN